MHFTGNCNQWKQWSRRETGSLSLRRNSPALVLMVSGYRLPRYNDLVQIVAALQTIWLQRTKIAYWNFSSKLDWPLECRVMTLECMLELMQRCNKNFRLYDTEMGTVFVEYEKLLTSSYFYSHTSSGIKIATPGTKVATFGIKIFNFQKSYHSWTGATKIIQI